MNYLRSSHCRCLAKRRVSAQVQEECSLWLSRLMKSAQIRIDFTNKPLSSLFRSMI
ncbi:unnamed protein product [Moneuplotes crassus]|uniref:Uncharacterized protein n=1 Tax=Euplotes crassus TaxID=5936 RepID=A0AAD2CYM9_EUPCR|nr:unnamed protein product [Moneuplotes crassus]